MRDLDWRVIRELVELRTRFREVLEKALLPLPSAAVSGSTAFAPTTDIWETEDDVVVAIELPGATNRNVDVRLEGSTLVVSGELPAVSDPAGRFVRVERPRGRFHRTFPLPAGVAGEPRAVLQAGVLEVRLPRARPKRLRLAPGGGRQ